VCTDIPYWDRYDGYMGNHASSIHKFDGIIASLYISRYGEPETLGEFLRKRRLENDLLAKELADLIGVTEDTVLNWEKDRTTPSQRHILILKERLSIDPFELMDLGAISERQKSILDLITERGQITRGECQELLGLRQQYAQNDLYFLYKLGILGRTLGARKKATYFIPKDIEGRKS
jgi:transcriptional regulator with XRE-family HTH domain